MQGANYEGGPGLIDTRKKKFNKWGREIKREWEVYFGRIYEVRWDMFEDFLISEFQRVLSDPVSLPKTDFARNVNWRGLIKDFYQSLSKKCESNEKIRELPEIPFSKDSQESQEAYRGHTVTLEDYSCLCEEQGFLGTFSTKAKEFTVPGRDSVECLPFRRYYIDQIKYDYSDGSTYYGDFRNGFKDGHGFIKLSSGDMYTGQFLNGKREGEGKMIYKDYSKNKKIVYEGSFENDWRHGYGVMTISNGGKFSGDWLYGLQSYGVYNGPKGANYVGSWKGGKMDQEGRLKEDGKEYRGRMEEGKFLTGELLNEETGKKIIRVEQPGSNSIVSRIETHQFVYEGGIYDDLEHGYGVKSWVSGAVYKGDWKKGKQEGKGEYHAVTRGIGNHYPLKTRSGRTG